MKNKFVVPFFLLLIVVMGCSSLQQYVSRSGPEGSNTASNSSTSDVPVNDEASPAFTPSGDAKADIEKMADRFLNLKEFTAKMETESAMPMRADLEYSAPDRFRIRTYLPNDQTSEMVIIGKQTYMKMGSRWQKMPLNIGSDLPNMRETFTREGMKWFKNMKYEGEETVNGKAAYVYSYSGSAPGGGSEYNSRVWVSKSDGKPIKIEAKYPKGELRSMSITYDYDTKVVIEPPTP